MITRHKVFLNPAGRLFIYKWANALHAVTRENVIRATLLFKSGDEYDREIIEESERRLRRLAFLGGATITRQIISPDSVDIEVETRDQWSTLVSAIINHGGGRTELGAAVEEFNFLGFGKQLFAEIHRAPEGITFTLKFDDPQLFGSRWTTSSTAITGPLQDSFTTELIRPFFSPDTRWAGGFIAAASDDIRREFSNGKEIDRFRIATRDFRMLLARALGKRFNKTRVQLSYRFADRKFSAISSRTTSAEDLPANEVIHALSLRLSREKLHFGKEKQIDHFVRTEDLTLGSFTSLTLGRTGLPVPKGIRRFELSASSSQRLHLSAAQYLFLNAGFSTLFKKDNFALLRLRYYNKSLPWQTLALHARLDYGWNLEASRQFLLGGDSGLRGYGARAFAGNRRLFFNFEDRLFSKLNILTVALGGIIFLDAGYAWPEAETFRLADLKYSIGVGLRLGYTRSPNSRVGRIDLAWPLSAGGGFGVFIGVDQIFSLN